MNHELRKRGQSLSLYSPISGLAPIRIVHRFRKLAQKKGHEQKNLQLYLGILNWIMRITAILFGLFILLMLFGKEFE